MANGVSSFEDSYFKTATAHILNRCGEMLRFTPHSAVMSNIPKLPQLCANKKILVQFSVAD